MDCCPPHYTCISTPSARGICLPPVGSNDYNLTNQQAPIGNPALFSSTRSRDTLRQPREAFTDPFVSRYDLARQAWVWDKSHQRSVTRLAYLVVVFYRHETETFGLIFLLDLSRRYGADGLDGSLLKLAFR